MLAIKYRSFTGTSRSMTMQLLRTSMECKIRISIPNKEIDKFFITHIVFNAKATTTTTATTAISLAKPTRLKRRESIRALHTFLRKPTPPQKTFRPAHHSIVHLFHGANGSLNHTLAQHRAAHTRANCTLPHY